MKAPAPETKPQPDDVDILTERLLKEFAALTEEHQETITKVVSKSIVLITLGMAFVKIASEILNDEPVEKKGKSVDELTPESFNDLIKFL